MALLKRVSRPFGEVHVDPLARDSRRRVRASVPMGVCRSGTQTGVALDASGSMDAHYADPTGRGSALAPVARNLCTLLARGVDGGGGTTAIFWALGETGGDIQVAGDLTAEQAARHPFAKPHRLGGGTQLLPPVRYFVERFEGAPWGLYGIVTDGTFGDLPAVRAYTLDLAQAIKAGRRAPLSFLLVGFGAGVSEGQMEQLAGATVGTDLPSLWDFRLVRDLAAVPDAFGAAVAAAARVAQTGAVIAPDGTVLRDYSGGVPGVLTFSVPAGTTYFTLVADGRRYHQGLSDEDGLGVPGAEPPPGVPTGGTVAGVVPGTRFVKEVPPVPGAANSGGAFAAGNPGPSPP